MALACFSCEQNFATRSVLDKHVQSGTLCLVCDRQICKNTNMFKHLTTCLHAGVRQCTGCRCWFPTHEELCEHIITAKCWQKQVFVYPLLHNQRVVVKEKIITERVVVCHWQCLFCAQTFQSATDSQEHFKKHMSQMSKQCPICEGFFFNEQKYAYHMAKFHHEPIMAIPISGDTNKGQSVVL